MANRTIGEATKVVRIVKAPPAICKWCGNNMVKGGSCGTFMEWAEIHGKTVNVLRIAYPVLSTGPCHDCGVAPGAIHHEGCDTEVCGFCGEQAISCTH